MQDVIQALERYFSAVAAYSTGLLDRLPISPAIESIEATFNRLQPALEQIKTAELQQMSQTQRPLAVVLTQAQAAGMNTIGILADRLTILVCKEWYLRHRQGNPHVADEVRESQIPDIVQSLARALPGHARLLEKVSANHAQVNAHSFEEAYYGLLMANILMWETQEMLYLRDMEAVPAEELRDYIRFFSKANMMRNAYITQCEVVYWSRC
jgi:hypothetical protein